MARMTRAEAREATRGSLIASARKHFAEVGYGAASLDLIAEDAGFTRGAIYANFDGKAGLLLAVLDERLDGQLQELGRIEGSLDAVNRWRRDNASREEGLALAVREFRAIGMRDPAIRNALRDRERRVRAGFAEMIEAFARNLRIELPASPEDTASVLLALGDGISEQHQLDPDHVSMELFNRALTALLGDQTTSSPSNDRPTQSR